MFAPDEDVVWEVVAAVILEEPSVQGDSQLSVLTSRGFSCNVELINICQVQITAGPLLPESYKHRNKRTST